MDALPSSKSQLLMDQPSKDKGTNKQKPQTESTSSSEK